MALAVEEAAAEPEARVVPAAPARLVVTPEGAGPDGVTEGDGAPELPATLVGAAAPAF